MGSRPVLKAASMARAYFMAASRPSLVSNFASNVRESPRKNALLVVACGLSGSSLLLNHDRALFMPLAKSTAPTAQYSHSVGVTSASAIQSPE